VDVSNPANYHRMTVAEKQAYQRGRIREPAVVCPTCETQLAPADLPAHVAQRCPGRREPHPAAAWVTWREALQLVGVRGTLAGWVRRGLVRTKGEVQDRRYLLRDLTKLLAERAQRRKFTIVNRHQLDRGRTP
jgi:hypothetical protein